MEEYPLSQHYLDEAPTNKEEAFKHWKILSQVIQLLEIAYGIPDGKIEDALEILHESQDDL